MATRRHGHSILLAAFLAGLPAGQSFAASDADGFFCEQVYQEVQGVLERAGAPADADDAQMRSWKLSGTNVSLALEHPERLLAAREEADRRWAALAPSGAAREKALLDAYRTCGDLDGSNERDRLPQLVAYQQFCKIVLRSVVDRAKEEPPASTDSQERLRQMRAIVQALDAPGIRDVKLDRAADTRAGALHLQHSARLEAGPSLEHALAAEGAACHRAAMAGELGVTIRLEPPPVAASSSAPSADLGAVFRMREVAPGGNYDGTWTRRGATNIYDARWVYVPTGQVLTDVLEIAGIEQGELVIRRQGIRPLYGFDGVYRAKVGADGALAPGTANWVTVAGYHWEPADPSFRLPRSAAPASADKNADALFCKDVFVQAQAMFTAAGAAAEASYAMERGLGLVYFESSLKESDPAAYAGARSAADARLAAIPAGAGRGPPLRAAYDRCKASGGGDAPPSAAARQAAEQRFCQKLLTDVTVTLRESPETLDDRSKGMMKGFAELAAALDAPAIQFRTDLTPKDSLDAEALESQMNAALDAQLGKGKDDEAIGDAVVGCYRSYDSGALGVSVPGR